MDCLDFSSRWRKYGAADIQYIYIVIHSYWQANYATPLVSFLSKFCDIIPWAEIFHFISGRSSFYSGSTSERGSFLTEPKVYSDPMPDDGSRNRSSYRSTLALWFLNVSSYQKCGNNQNDPNGPLVGQSHIQPLLGEHHHVILYRVKIVEEARTVQTHLLSTYWSTSAKVVLHGPEITNRECICWQRFLSDSRPHGSTTEVIIWALT